MRKAESGKDLLPWQPVGRCRESGWVSGKHRVAAWFQIVVGVAIIGWWAVAAATNGIVELNEGRIDILFHIVAELVMAVLLIAAGVSIRRNGRTRPTTALSGLALGTLLYSSINSPGYFAERGEWWMVGMFAVIAGATVAAVVLLVTDDGHPGEAEQPRARPIKTGYGRTP